jgi:hypothetical protein
MRSFGDHVTEEHPLDAATELTRAGEHILRGATHPDYWNFTGPFGGFTGGVFMRALLMQEHIGDPVAMTVNYCAPLAEGAFEIAVKCTRTNRSSQHWSFELTQPDAGIVATATAISALRRETWSNFPKQAPSAPPAEEVERLPWRGRVAWLDRYEFRFVAGAPNFSDKPSAESGSARSLLWMADQPRRNLDFVSLMALSDAFFGRIAHVRSAIVPFGTVSMTTYFHVSAGELAGEGDAFVLGDADSTVFTRGFHDQVAEIWSRSGRPLLTSHQIVYYRD